MTAHAHAALEQLTDLLGNRLLTDPESAQRYGVDWTKVWAPAPSAIALPETIDEVQQIVEIANDHGLHLVPSGGRTGLSAGAVAANGELVVAFDRMNKILDFNEFDRAVTVQPGVITQQLQEFADEKGLFDFNDVVEAISEKLVRRHPHVFDNPAGESISENQVKDRWEAIKSGERAEKNQIGALQDVPLALPALSRAQKLQKRAARVGFDWPEQSGALAKVDEELLELREALAEGDAGHIESELGDIFLALVNFARHLGVDAESSLRHANARFETRLD